VGESGLGSECSNLSIYPPSQLIIQSPDEGRIRGEEMKLLKSRHWKVLGGMLLILTLVLSAGVSAQERPGTSTATAGEDPPETEPEEEPQDEPVENPEGTIEISEEEAVVESENAPAQEGEMAEDAEEDDEEGDVGEEVPEDDSGEENLITGNPEGTFGSEDDGTQSEDTFSSDGDTIGAGADDDGNDEEDDKKDREDDSNLPLIILGVVIAGILVLIGFVYARFKSNK